MWLISDLRDFEEATQMFGGAEPVGGFDDYVMKRKLSEISAYYGVYKNDKLIGYFWLLRMRNHINTLKGYEFHVHDDWRGKGIGTFFYHHIVQIEKCTVVNDYMHTVGSSHLWQKMRTMPEYKVGQYNAISDTFDYETPIDMNNVYANDYMHLATRPILLSDIDVDNANSVNTNVVDSTMRAYATTIQSGQLTHGKTKPFKFEI